MKVLSIVAVITLCEIVKGWVTALQPIVLSIGAAFGVLNNDIDLVPDLQPVTWKKWLSSKEENKTQSPALEKLDKPMRAHEEPLDKDVIQRIVDKADKEKQKELTKEEEKELEV